MFMGLFPDSVSSLRFRGHLGANSKSRRSKEREWRRKTCSYSEDCILELSRIFTNARKPRVAKERELCLHSYYIFVKTKALASANFASKAKKGKNTTRSRSLGYARSA